MQTLQQDIRHPSTAGHGLFEQLVAGLFRLAARFISHQEKAFAERVARRELRKLLDMPEDHLRDLGVTRDDVRSALALPLSQSAGRSLEDVRDGCAR